MKRLFIALLSGLVVGIIIAAISASVFHYHPGWGIPWGIGVVVSVYIADPTRPSN